MDRIEIKASSKKTVTLAIYGVCLIGVGIFLFVIAEQQSMAPALLLKLLSSLFLIIFVPALAFLLYRDADDSPRIIIDSSGLTDHSALTSPGFVPWHKIEDFQIRTIHAVPLLGIILKNPEAFYDSSNPISRIYNKLNYKVFKAAWFISVETLDIEFDEFAEQVMGYHRNYGMN